MPTDLSDPSISDVWRRFLDKIEVTYDHWWWQGWVDKRNGYGRFWYEGENIGAHVMSCHLFFGTPIHRPRSETVDHLCRERLCVRPSHLKPGTHSDNMLRALDTHIHASKTHCPQGHEYTPDNINYYFHPDGRIFRRCLTCKTEWNRRRASAS